MIVTLVFAFEDHAAASVVGDERSFTHHAVVAAIIVEHKLIVGKVLWPQIRFTFYDDITFTPATLPGANDDFTKASAVVIATAAGEDEEKGSQTGCPL